MIVTYQCYLTNKLKSRIRHDESANVHGYLIVTLSSTQVLFLQYAVELATQKEANQKKQKRATY
jgi:hypothetical protein